MAWMEQVQATNGGQAALCAAGAYVLGCFATGYYLVRARAGRDIREIESGSIGARNVSCVLGKTGFFLTVLGDVAKGILAVWAVQRFTGNDLLAALAMLAVVVGHIWPAQLFFRGGKGVATSLGALVVYDYQLVIAFIVIFAGGLALTRRTILPGLFAYICLPFASYWLDHDGLKVGVVTLLGLMVLFAHRNNIVEEIPALAARRGVAAKPERPKL
jgi:acyl phosphate:glycerol-3-phosphate acyltransferase